MQKMFHVSLVNENNTVIWDTIVMGFYTVPKLDKNGNPKVDAQGNELTTSRPFTKQMAIDMAYDEFLGSKTAAQFRAKKASWCVNGRPVFGYNGLPMSTISQLSSAGVSKSLSPVVEIITLKGMSADALGKKRNADGTRIRSKKSKKSEKKTIDGKPVDTSVKTTTTTVPTAAKAEKSARNRIRKAA